MRELAQITSLGLSPSEAVALQSILKIVQGLKKNFSLLEPNRVEHADLIFVDATNTEAWSKIRNQAAHATPILIGDRDDFDGSVIRIRRPIVLKRVRSAIDCAIDLSSGAAAEKAAERWVTRRVLVVDDSFPVRKYMEGKLPELCPEPVGLHFASSGREAVEACKASRFDTVFLDVVMPDINGYKICKWIKSVSPTTAVIMLSGKKSPIDKVRGSMSGCDAYLTKPPAEEKLQAICQKYIFSSNSKDQVSS